MLGRIDLVNNRHPLGQLIRSIQEAQGWSDRDLEARAVGKQGLGKSNLSKIKNHPVSALKGSVIKGLSELLQVPESLIAKAALESMDISLSDPPAKTLEDAVRNEPELTAKERRILLAVVSEMRSDKEVVGNGDHPTHMTQAGESPATQKILPNTSVSNTKVSHLKRAGRKQTVDEHAHPDADERGHIPLPADYYDLAADSSRNYGAEEDARARERGEETQDTGQDN